MENEISALEYNQAFIQQQQKAFRQLIATLQHLLTIDSDIFVFLCDVQQPYIPSFWKLHSKIQRMIRSPQKLTAVTELTSLFYRILQTQNAKQKTYSKQIISNQIQVQYTKVVQSIAQIPQIVKKCQQISKIKQVLEQTHNISLILQLINSTISNVTIFQESELPQNLIFRWKMQACRILILKALNKIVSINYPCVKNNYSIKCRLYKNSIKNNTTNKQNNKQTSKSEMLKFLRKTKVLMKQARISKESLLKTYKMLLYYSIKFADQDLVFLQLQIQNFKKCTLLSRSQIIQINILLDDCLKITKHKVNHLVQQAWGQDKNPNQERQIGKSFRKSHRRKSIGQKFLLQTSELIFRFDPQKRQQIRLKRKLNHKSLHDNVQSRNKKRVGFITNRNSITRQIKNDVNNNQSYSMPSFKVQYRRNIYRAAGQIPIKQPTITNEDLIFEMQNFRHRILDTPLITDNQILLQSKDRKLNKTRSLKFRGRTQVMENCILGDIILSYFQIFGNEFYQFQIYEQERIQDQSIGFGFNIRSGYAPTYQFSFQNGKKHLFYEQFKKYVTNSQLYFQLMQQRLEQPIQINQTQLFISCFCQFTTRLIDRNQANLLISLVKMLKLYFYWYYTQVSKLNGVVMSRRPNIKVTDSLKFSIALQFLKKNNLNTCLRQFNNVRNKVGLRQCFVYLSSGRQILIKTLIRHHLQLYMCTFVLNLDSYNSFIIDPKKKTLPYFNRIEIYQHYYNPSSWKTQNQYRFQHSNHFTSNQMTIIMLSNIIHKHIPKKQVKKFLDLKANFQTQFIVSQEKKLNFEITLKYQNEEDSPFSISRSKPAELTIKKELIHLLPVLKLFSQIYDESFNYSLRCKRNGFVIINDQYYKKQQLLFGGNTQLVTFELAKKVETKYIYLHNPKKQVQHKSFEIIKSAYHDKIAAQVDLKNAIFRLNSVKKNIKQEYCKKNIRSIAKTVIKTSFGKFIYVAVTQNTQFQYFRFQFYFPSQQRKYFTILTHEKVIENSSLQYAAIHNNILNKTDQKIYSTAQIKLVQKMQFNQLLQKQRTIWKSIVKQELQIQHMQNYIYLFGLKYLMFQTFGSLEFINADNLQGGKIQLVEIQSRNKLYYLIHDYNQHSQSDTSLRSSLRCSLRFQNSKMFIGQPDQNPFSYSMNLFADHICKQYKINLYTDLLVRLYLKFVNAQLTMSDIKVCQLSDIHYFD